jgi:hypothetical protein
MIFPIQFETALRKITKAQNLVLRAYEYHGLELRVIKWYVNNILYRLQFEEPEDKLIKVIIHRDVFKIFPRLLSWCHNNIPMFPYLADIKFDDLGLLSTDLTEHQFSNKINEFIKRSV